jgi:uncharacterized protein (TIGR02145 family)
MKKLLLMFFFSLAFVLHTQSQSFKSTKIGKQVWMAENLNVDKFRNGDPIQEVKSQQDWIIADSLKIPVWCYVDFDQAKNKSYGKLYNWYAVSDSRGLAPIGWHVPTKEEWTTLIDYTNNTYVQKDNSSEEIEIRGLSCDTCKSIDSLYYTPAGYSQLFKSKLGWITEEDDEKILLGNRDSTGFCGLPGGYYDGGIKHMNSDFYGYFWSASEVQNGSSSAWGYILDSDYLMCIGSVEWELSKVTSDFISENGVLDEKKYKELYNSFSGGTTKSSCLSIRCVKD